MAYNNGSIIEDSQLERQSNWTHKPFITLGIWFSNDRDKMPNLNTTEKFDLIMNINTW